MEYWNVGIMEYWIQYPSFQYSTIPVFHLVLPIAYIHSPSALPKPAA
jgi:hypothetical protein